MHKRNNVNNRSFTSVLAWVLIPVPVLAKRSLMMVLFVGVTGCGSGDSTSTGDTTPTNPQPAASSTYAARAASTTQFTEMGGAVLLPGIYLYAQSMQIGTGDLVLDAQGNTNALWILQIETDLHVAGGRRVILSAGAQAANVYWQVGGSATLEEYSVFQGNLFANGATTLRPGAHWEGQPLADPASVTLAARAP